MKLYMNKVEKTKQKKHTTHVTKKEDNEKLYI